jgi:hypothetical protein
MGENGYNRSRQENAATLLHTKIGMLVRKSMLSGWLYAKPTGVRYQQTPQGGTERSVGHSGVRH